jgi:hypothetical protein
MKNVILSGAKKLSALNIQAITCCLYNRCFVPQHDKKIPLVVFKMFNYPIPKNSTP